MQSNQKQADVSSITPSRRLFGDILKKVIPKYLVIVDRILNKDTPNQFHKLDTHVIGVVCSAGKASDYEVEYELPHCQELVLFEFSDSH